MDERTFNALHHSQVIDLTTTGRRTGRPRKIEIFLHEEDGLLFITGMPRSDRTRDWIHNITADPQVTLHLKQSITVDIPVVIDGAGIFLGLSPRGVKPQTVKRTADRPLILALANPTPEIMPEEAKAARPDCIIATGRSDYPNQEKNVLFSRHLRGALDVAVTRITEEMKLAATHAIAERRARSSRISWPWPTGRPALRSAPSTSFPNPSTRA